MVECHGNFFRPCGLPFSNVFSEKISQSFSASDQLTVLLPDLKRLIVDLAYPKSFILSVFFFVMANLYKDTTKKASFLFANCKLFSIDLKKRRFYIMLMLLPKTINERFYKALKEKQGEYGRGFNKFLCGETGYSTGYMSQVLNGNQAASQEAQMKISAACGLDYKSFLEEPTVSSNPRFEIRLKKLEEKIDRQFYKPTKNIQDKKLKKIEEYYNVVKEYQDQETAISINKKLVEIEKIDPEKFREIDEDLGITLKRLLKKQGEASGNLPGEGTTRSES